MRKYKAFIVSFFISFLTYGQQTKIIEGDLFFRTFDIWRIFDNNQSTLDSIANLYLNINLDTITKKDRKDFEVFRTTFKKHLHEKPYVCLKIKKSNFNLIVSLEDYEKLKKYKYDDLVETNKKIIIKAEVSEDKYFYDKVFICKKILEIKTVTGQTYNNKDNTY